LYVLWALQNLVYLPCIFKIDGNIKHLNGLLIPKIPKISVNFEGEKIKDHILECSKTSNRRFTVIIQNNVYEIIPFGTKTKKKSSFNSHDYQHTLYLTCFCKIQPLYFLYFSILIGRKIWLVNLATMCMLCRRLISIFAKYGNFQNFDGNITFSFTGYSIRTLFIRVSSVNETR